jgi:hypothetical protein
MGRCPKAKSMTHPLYRLLKLLDHNRLPYRIDRNRPDTLTITVTVVGERLEVDVFEDGHMEYSRFTGSEGVEEDSDSIEQILERHGREQNAS